MERLAGVAILVVALVVGGALRAWLALNDDGIYWPDEIFQSLEPAHRLVFGYGVTAWEWIEGARNWTLAGFVAGLLALATIVGLEQPREYLTLVRLAFVLINLATAAAVYRLARAHASGVLAAGVGVAFFAMTEVSIYFSARALSETASMLPVVLGLALALRPAASRGERLLGVALLGLSVYFRLLTALFAVGVLVHYGTGGRLWSPPESWPEWRSCLGSWTI